MLVEGQIVGGVVHGIGNALLERMVYEENGQPLTTNFGEYLLPTATELPRIEVLHAYLAVTAQSAWSQGRR